MKINVSEPIEVKEVDEPEIHIIWTHEFDLVN
jgi:hypothetical protein